MDGCAPVRIGSFYVLDSSNGSDSPLQQKRDHLVTRANLLESSAGERPPQICGLTLKIKTRRRPADRNAILPVPPCPETTPNRRLRADYDPVRRYVLVRLGRAFWFHSTDDNTKKWPGPKPGYLPGRAERTPWANLTGDSLAHYDRAAWITLLWERFI